ncbi:MAG: amino acid permease [Balneolaceae bacterium]
MPILRKTNRLKKELTLFDVYAISTGAMFSSGFFLLPGLAAAQTGPSVFLAYLAAGICVLPALFSVAELSTAMPRAGGTYYFVDRSLGPAAGTIGGIGSWFALVFKSAFALIGMGAYLALFMDVPIIPIAIALTIVFGILNIVGAKETTGLQKILVAALVVILAFYLVQGVSSIFSIELVEENREKMTPFFEFGAVGFIATMGFVFVSYAGLTKVASISEEVKNPERNIPLGMILSLLTATIVYVLGVYIMVLLLDPSELKADLTPVATAGEEFMNWLPGSTGLILIVIAAIAAFASTGNAGIMSASRYPLAMARDKLLPDIFSKLGRFGTPTLATVITTVFMIILLVTLEVEAVAKLASAFELLLFAILCFAVIVMRESKIEAYDPGFKSPWYPWMQVSGLIAYLVLIVEMGVMSILFTLGLAVASILWYQYYGKEKITRQGAIFHVHARLGERVDRGLDREMRIILREKGLRKGDPFEEVLAQALVIDHNTSEVDYNYIVREATEKLSDRTDLSFDELFEKFSSVQRSGNIPLGRGVVLNHVRVQEEISPVIVLVRVPGIKINTDGYEMLTKKDGEDSKVEKIRAGIFLLSSYQNSALHLRILAHLAEIVDTTEFIERWKNAQKEDELREILLRDERFVRLVVSRDNKTEEFIGKRIKDLSLPGQSLITIIRRNDKIKIPHGTTELLEGDELSIIGEIADIKELKKQDKS